MLIFVGTPLTLIFTLYKLPQEFHYLIVRGWVLAWGFSCYMASSLHLFVDKLFFVVTVRFGIAP